MLATVGRVVALLNELGVPNTQAFWEDQKPPPLPYVVLMPHGSANLHADGTVRFDARRYDLELYAKPRDIALEHRIKAALRDAEVDYDSDFAIDEKGQVAITYFNVTLIEQEASNG